MKNIIVAAVLGVVSVTAAQAQEMPEGDVAAGEKVFRKCMACHVADDAKNKVGPHLMNLLGRTAGSIEDYRYSKAMTTAGEEGLVWTEESLDAYLKAPRKFVKGTKMAFAGLRKEDEIKDVVAYLAQFDTDGMPEEDASTYQPPS